MLHAAQGLKELSGRLLQIQDEERRRVARDLHDSAGQMVTALDLELGSLAEDIRKSAPHLGKKLESSQKLLQQLHREIRTTSYLLHPPLLDEAGLNSALSWYVQGLSQRSGIGIELEIPEGFGRLPRDLELAIFRLVQESLTNIHRHSGSKRLDPAGAEPGGGFCGDPGSGQRDSCGEAGEDSGRRIGRRDLRHARAAQAVWRRSAD